MNKQEDQKAVGISPSRAIWWGARFLFYLWLLLVVVPIAVVAIFLKG
jgi:hypothetical protein